MGKRDIKAGIEAVRGILARLIHMELQIWQYLYEQVEARYDLDRYLDGKEVEKLRQELGGEKFEELTRYLAGSFAGYDPKLELDEN